MRANDGTGQIGYTSPRHVWVRVDEVAAPGLLMDWRTENGRWLAHVIYATGDARATTEWVDESRVRECK
jgi:hypothetical protein